MNLGASLLTLLYQILGLSWCLLWFHSNTVFVVQERRRQLREKNKVQQIRQMSNWENWCFSLQWFLNRSGNTCPSVCLLLCSVIQPHCCCWKSVFSALLCEDLHLFLPTIVFLCVTLNKGMWFISVSITVFLEPGQNVKDQVKAKWGSLEKKVGRKQTSPGRAWDPGSFDSRIA